MALTKSRNKQGGSNFRYYRVSIEQRTLSDASKWSRSLTAGEGKPQIRLKWQTTTHLALNTLNMLGCEEERWSLGSTPPILKTYDATEAPLYTTDMTMSAFQPGFSKWCTPWAQLGKTARVSPFFFFTFEGHTVTPDGHDGILYVLFRCLWAHQDLLKVHRHTGMPG